MKPVPLTKGDVLALEARPLTEAELAEAKGGDHFYGAWHGGKAKAGGGPGADPESATAWPTAEGDTAELGLEHYKQMMPDAMVVGDEMKQSMVLTVTATKTGFSVKDADGLPVGRIDRGSRSTSSYSKSGKYRTSEGKGAKAWTATHPDTKPGWSNPGVTYDTRAKALKSLSEGRLKRIVNGRWVGFDLKTQKLDATPAEKAMWPKGTFPTD